MCHFITAVVARADLASLFETHQLAHQPIANPHLAAQLAVGELQILTTRGHCDCGTALGSKRKLENREPHARELAKLRKKGWSETKIRRWLEQKRETQERDRRAAGARERPEVDSWLAFLDDALAQMPRIGLLLHFYGGGIESERITISRQRVPRAELTSERLLTMEEDVVYEFLRA